MKKSLLLMLAFIGGLASTVSAETRYVPIAHSYQLVEGAKYAVGAVGTNAANSTNWTDKCPRFFSRGENGTVSVVVHADRASFDSAMLWEMKVHADRACTSSGANHPHPERVVSMHQGENYIVQSVESGEDFVFRNGTSSLNTQSTADKTTEVEFVAVPVPEVFNSTTPLFVMHGGRNEDESFYRSMRAVKYDGAFDRYTATNDLRLANDGTFTTYFEVYLQIDDANPAAAAEALWKGELVKTAETALSRMPDVSTEARVALVNTIDEIPLPDNVEWQGAGLEDQVAAAANTAEFFAKVKERIDPWVTEHIHPTISAASESYRISGLFTESESSAFTEAGQSVTSIGEAVNKTEFAAACETLTANIATAEAPVWSMLDGVQVGIKFDRLSSYITSGTGSAVYAPSSFSVGAIWQLQYVEGNKFKFYNPAVKGWLGYTTTHVITEETDAAIFTIDLFTGATEAHANTLVITNTALSGANVCVHKSASGTGMIVFNSGDNGSALRFVRGEAAIRNAYVASNAVPTTHPQKSANFDAAIAEAGYDEKYTELQTYVNSLTAASDLAVDTDGDAFAAIREYDMTREACMAYIKLTPTDNSSHTLHYTTNHSASGGNTLMYFDGEDETEANSIWIYSLGKLTNYSNGLRVQVGKGGVGSTHFGMCIAAADNTGEALRFYDGHNAAGTVQIVFGNNRGLHIHTWNGHLSANACGNSTATRPETLHNLNIELVKSLPVEIHSDGWGSFYSPIAFSVPENSGCTKFYAGKLEGESLVLVEGTNGSIYAGGTAILIKGTPNSTIHVSVEYAAENALTEYIGAFEGTTVAAVNSLAQTAGLTTFAKTAPAESSPAVFAADEIVNLTAVGESAPVNTMCYTVADTNSDIQGSVLPLNVTKSASGIERVEVRNLDGTVEIYDLQGRRLAAPVRGVNIVNGRKVLVK